MRVDDLGVAFVQRDTAVDQQIAIDAVQSIDLAILVGNQRRPVKLRLARRPAKTLRLLEVFGEVRAVDQQFFRHAANVHTRTTQVATFGHSHFRAKTGGETRSPHASGTGTNHVKVKIVGHFQSPRQATSITTRLANSGPDCRRKSATHPSTGPIGLPGNFQRAPENYHPVGRLTIASRLVSSYEEFGGRRGNGLRT
ncbi:hypothetical protein D3C76_900050 [compost metagenome]